MTPQEHKVQRDMVLRSLLVASKRSDRSEERPRKHVQRHASPVFVDVPTAHVFVIPTVNETRPL